MWEWKNIDYSDLTFKLALIVLVPFKCSIQKTGTFSSRKRLDRDSCNLHFCTKAGCIDTFSSQGKLEIHLLQDTHSFASKTTSMDIVRNHFVELVHQSSHKIIGSINQPSSCGSAERTILSNKFEKQGWALPKQNATRFTYQQRKFIYDTFMQGEETKKKITPEKVVVMMKTMSHSDGSKFFKPHEFKNKDQSKSLFSGMLQQQRAGKIKKPEETSKDQLQCDILTETVEPDQSNGIEESMNIVENYFKLKVIDFVYVSLANERKKKSFP